MRFSSRNLLILAAVLIGAWLLMHRQGGTASLPWNRGQAGSIFQPGLRMGGGQ